MINHFADTDGGGHGAQADAGRRLGGEIAVERRPPTGKSFRFVRVVRAGEAKLRERARGVIPQSLRRRQTKCFSSPAVGGWSPGVVPRLSPCGSFWLSRVSAGGPGVVPPPPRCNENRRSQLGLG